jgi:hypothetical protein
MGPSDLKGKLLELYDVERILKIPLSEQLIEDFIAWHYTKTYTFSVRSAYYLEWEHQFGAKTRSK